MGLLVQRPGVTQAQTSLPGMLHLPASGTWNVQRPYNAQRDPCLPFGPHKCELALVRELWRKICSFYIKIFPNKCFLHLFSCARIASSSKRLRVWTAATLVSLSLLWAKEECKAKRQCVQKRT
eukprot:9490350-Pyramimonas_sp.AAC.1